MTGEQFQRWRERHELSVVAAARTLGLSRRTIQYYEKGKRSIPRVVELACRGADLAGFGDLLRAATP
jgi:predicted transcriptional regulator